MNEGQNKEKLLELCKKLSRLISHAAGNENEKANAKNLLEDYMKRFNLNEEDFCDDKKSIYEFVCQTPRERSLLRQTAAKVSGEYPELFSYKKKLKKKTNTFMIELTKADYIEVDFLFSFYKNLYKKEEDMLYMAFVQKNEIFKPYKEGDKGQEIDDESYLKMKRIMQGLDDATPLKQIGVEK